MWKRKDSRKMTGKGGKRKKREKERKRTSYPTRKRTGCAIDSVKGVAAMQTYEIVSHKADLDSDDVTDDRFRNEDEIEEEELQETRKTYERKFRRVEHLVRVGELSKAMSVITIDAMTVVDDGMLSQLFDLHPSRPRDVR